MRGTIPMNASILLPCGAALLVALSACEPPAPPVVAPAPTGAPKPAEAPPKAVPSGEPDFRDQAPQASAELPFTPPKIEEAKLGNGVRVLLVERHELPIVSVEIVTDHGADQGPPGVGGFLGAMLLQGTKTRSALKLSDDLDKLGAQYGAAADYDSAPISARVLSTKLPETLAILADVAQSPAFAKAEIERQRSERLTRILQQNDQPQALLARAVSATLYPDGHPYGTPLLGTEESVGKIDAAALGKLYKTLFQPERVTIAFAGDITKERAVAEAERAFGKWKSTADAKAPTPEDPKAPPPAGAERVFLLDRPGSTQSFVSVALPGTSRRSADFDALVVMNTILGGQFSSRVNLNLREKHAYTYGARSAFSFFHGPGAFSVGGAIVRESTGPAVQEILTELDRIRKDPVTDEELAAAKSLLIRALPARFESTSSTADALAGLAIYGLPLDDYATRPARLQRVTPQDVLRVAQAYLPALGFRVVVVGDASVAKDQLAKVGLGAVTMKEAPKGASAAAKGDKPAAGDKPGNGDKAAPAKK
jgi:zinc protease